MHIKSANLGRRMSSPRRQKGMSMIEMGLVLVIITLAIVGVVTAFSNNSASTQANQLSNDLSLLIGKVKSSYSGQYANVSNAKLSSGGFFSNLTSLTNTAGTVTTGLGGGTLTVSPGTVTAANDSVKYVITQVPDSACLPFVTALSKTSTTLTVGSNSVKSAGGVPDPSKITCAADNTTITIQVQ
jgi:type II secretory pathway pseudopilin PulG